MSTFKIADALALRAGKDFELSSVDPSSTPGFDGSKDELAARLCHYDEELYELQERLYANGRAYGDKAPSVLVILQGMDTSGKGVSFATCSIRLIRRARTPWALASRPRKG